MMQERINKNGRVQSIYFSSFFHNLIGNRSNNRRKFYVVVM